jgi:hypothetical protein
MVNLGMDNTSIGYIIITATAIVLAALFYVFTRSTAEKTIREYLQERGAANISVYHDWFDFDRDTITFQVQFTSPNGKKHETWCKLHPWGLFVDGQIFWSDPVGLDLIPIEPKQAAATHSEYSKCSEKIRSHTDKEFPTFDISTVLSIPDSDDKIVMMQYLAPFQNVFRCQIDGTIVWQAELPTSSGDVYTNIAWKDGQLTAFSRSCVSVILDVKTGQIIAPKMGV